jgi:hypothetical protein
MDEREEKGWRVKSAVSGIHPAKLSQLGPRGKVLLTMRAYVRDGGRRRRIRGIR